MKNLFKNTSLAAYSSTTTLMKLKIVLSSTITALLMAGCAAERHEHLQAQAKISKEDATKTALAQVPNGMVKDSELEKEKGKLIYSFDIAVTGSSDIKEVAVDAITGQVVSVETETAGQAAKEADEDKAKAKKGKDTN